MTIPQPLYGRFTAEIEIPDSKDWRDLLSDTEEVLAFARRCAHDDPARERDMRRKSMRAAIEQIESALEMLP